MIKLCLFCTDHKQWKKFDAVVGDLTILANRTKYVEFTQPYAESGLSMIVPAQPEGSAWMFLKPLTWKMWLMTGVVLMYTMLIVWFLEHQFNPKFNGTLKNQIGTTLWFTFSTLFFAQSKCQFLYSVLFYYYYFLMDTNIWDYDKYSVTHGS